ncbi:MAG: fatty acyl-AMP ligase [Polyangiaceae bacterium]|nr:fatty acyl-AMP ligase [Polyangiaceae bacterium]
MSAKQSPSTLVEALEAVAMRQDVGFSHLTDEKRPVDFVSYAELSSRARRIAAALLDMGLVPGDRVALILPDSAQFIESMFGCMVAGMIAVPIYPPMNLAQLGTYLPNTAHILRRAGCRLVITDAQVRAVLGTLLIDVPCVRRIEEFTALSKRLGPNAEPRISPPTADTVAFLQFTSGSTARPKGVTLTHAQLLANINAFGTALGVHERDETSAVTWLPLYHDMGLIGLVFGSVRYAVRVSFIAPLLFLKRPAIWLRQISERRAQFSFAPNFAYGLCTTRIKDSEIQGLDLSSLEVAGCGAEPIQRATLEAFAKRFAPHGFRPEALLPCYGLAEHTLAATFTQRGTPVRSDSVDPEGLASGEARPATTNNAIDVVCCGRPFPGHELKIVDDAGIELPDGHVGHIRLKGPSVMRDYWDDPEMTARALRDGWLATGDLGYVKNGELYVCGREKDLIIIQGRNYHPSDIEWQVGQVPGVRRGNVVAFGLYDSSLGRERVVVAAEVRDPNTGQTLRDEAIARVFEALSLRVDEVITLAPGSLPKTSSGKLQRAKTVEWYRSGELGRGNTDSGKLGVFKHLAASQWGFVKAKLTNDR